MDPYARLHGHMAGFGMFIAAAGTRFEATYKTYSAAMYAPDTMTDNSQVEKGGKIIMPASALEALTRLHIQYPMLFKLTCAQTNRETHSGVLEFNSPEGYSLPTCIG